MDTNQTAAEAEPGPAKLKAWRAEHALSAADAARRMGVTRQTWHSWERGASIPPARFMVKLNQLTSGMVTANDFYCLPAEGIAA
jgi:DNA-binding XRE family transcriptional regulator